MSFENIQLPDFVVAGLYKDALVILNDVQASVPHTVTPTPPQPEDKIQQPAQPVKPDTPWYLGNNNKQITIVVKDANAVHVNDKHLDFLGKLLSACKLNLGDVAIVNRATKAVDYNQLKEILQPKHLILFDVNAQDIQLPFTVPHYQVQAYGGSSFLLAPSLVMIDGDTQEAKLEKSKLWLSLKKMFGI